MEPLSAEREREREREICILLGDMLEDMVVIQLSSLACLGVVEGTEKNCVALCSDCMGDSSSSNDSIH